MPYIIIVCIGPHNNFSLAHIITRHDAHTISVYISLPDFFLVFVHQRQDFGLGWNAGFDDEAVSKVIAGEGETEPWGHSQPLQVYHVAGAMRDL
jgi:hypothetical protein